MRHLATVAAHTVLLAVTALVLGACGMPATERPITPPTIAASPSTSPPTASTASPVQPSAGTPSEPPSSAPTPAPRPSSAPVRGNARVVRTIATGLEVPWGIDAFPDGALLASTRDERALYRIDDDSGRRLLLGRIPQAVSNVASGGEGGLLGVAVSPDFATDRRVYLYFSTASDNRIGYTTLTPGSPPGKWLGPVKVILDAIPQGIHHNGGRLAFGPDGNLFASTGESGVPSLAQDTASLGGKVLRMTPEGRPVPGNPFRGSVVYSYGHRNVQGLAFDAAGRLFASEFGEHDKDELNLIRPGRNYGWPQSQGSTRITGLTSPVAEFGTEEDSPSGIAIAGGSVWMAALAGERLWRIPLDGPALKAPPQSFLTGEYGRLRSVLTLDAHTIVVTTSNRDGRASPRAGDDRLLLVRVR